MKHTSYLLKIVLVCCPLWMACTSSSQREPACWKIQVMQGTPHEEAGIEQGVSACYAGFYQGRLLLAGGCNFPELPAAEGGKKRFYQGVYAAALSDEEVLEWKCIGQLPAPAAYGVALSTPQGVICVGGMNEQGAVSSVLRLSFHNETGQLLTDSLPSLPVTLDNMSGTYYNHCLYVAGGNVNGIPSNALYRLNLKRLENGWKRLADFPGPPRVQPVLAAQRALQGTYLYLWGGFAGAGVGRPATLSVDGYRYHPETDTWTSVATPVGADDIDISLGGGTSIALGDSLILCMGGVNKTVFLDALKREEQLKQALLDDNMVLVDSLKQAGKLYMTMPVEAYHFNDRVLVYNTHQDVWQEVLRTPFTARAGAVIVGLDSVFYHLHGELKPGIRTSSIVRISHH